MSRARGFVGLGIVIALSPVVIWWAVGDLSETVSDPDYMFRPLAITAAQELAIGLVATIFVVGALAVTALAVHRREITFAEIRALAPLLFFGIFCGYAWRVTTAGVIGANIGGALLMMLAPFLLLAMAVWSLVLWRRAR